MQNRYYPYRLVEHMRDGLVEQEHSGFVVLSVNGEIKEFGDTQDYPFYLRSCAKPLQASLLIDEKLDETLNLTSEEIAIGCASHAGEDCHVQTAKSFMYKADICEGWIRCGLHTPLAKSITCDEPTVFHNNCCGKHILMLALAKHFGFDVNTYFEKDHPLQKMIKKKVYELCEYNADTPVTKDGCGVPIFSMPLKNMLIGYINLFSNPKYGKIKEAFLNDPYIIGGEDRLDTKVMQGAPNCIAKVGAEGLCVVLNTLTNDGFIVKILDSDMPTREIVVLNIMNKLGWGHFEINKNIKTLHGDIVGQKEFLIEEL